MNLLKKCIQEPVIAIVLSLIILLLGLAAFQRLDIRYFPELKIPMVTVYTGYSGASADLMESSVTTPLENAFSGLDGVNYISSSSWAGGSYITVQFKLGGNFDQQVSMLRDKISSVLSNPDWPTDARAPSIKIGTNGSALSIVSITNPSMSPNDVSNYVRQYIIPQVQQVPGVGTIGLNGVSGYAMRIWLDPEKMTSLGITADDIKTAITADNIDFAGGTVRGASRNYGIISDTRLKTPQDFANIIVKQTATGTVRLSDIATVGLGSRSFTDLPLRVDGKQGLVMQVYPVQGVNPITLNKSVEETYERLKKSLPAGMTMTTLYNNTTYLKKSIDETFWTIAEAVLLVIIVVFMFLGSMRASIIPIVTIPVSLIGVFSFVYLFGFSINSLSLLGIVLAIGLVVDDAIVMLENIHRHIEEGLSPFQAAIKGSTEIASAVVAMSITLIAVYAPIGLVQGFTAKLFQEFAFTLAAAVVISGFVALTLTPMMCSRILKEHGQSEGRFAAAINRFFNGLAAAYGKLLVGVLKVRFFVVITMGVIFAFGVFLFYSLSQEFIPAEDEGAVRVSVVSPSGSSMQYTDRYTQQVEAMLKKFPAIESTVAIGGNASSNIDVFLKPWNQRKETPAEIVAELNPALKKIPGVDASAFLPSFIDYGPAGYAVSYNLMTLGSYQDLVTPVNALVAKLKQYPGLIDVGTSLKFDSQQYKISIKRDMAAALGVSLQDIADTVQTMMSGKHVTNVSSGKTSYDVIIQMQKKDLADISAFNKLYVRSTSGNNVGKLIPLSNLVTLTPTVGQSSLTHYDRMRSAEVHGRLAPGYTESQAINFVRKAAGQVENSQINGAFSGKAKQFIDSQGSMGQIVLMAIIFIFLVLAAQFKSFIDPFIVLLAVPLSTVGALLSLKITGGTINLFSQIGIVTLVGLISKHGILITQFVNNLREEGVAMTEAIIAGASIRLRPILMTTAAMVVGALPLALATGPGSVGREQIGWVIVGGLLFGTFFSLFVVPVVYSYLGVFKKLKNNQQSEPDLGVENQQQKNKANSVNAESESLAEKPPEDEK